MKEKMKTLKIISTILLMSAICSCGTRNVDKNEARFRTFKYEEFNALVSAMSVTTPVSVDAINDVFRQGLLFITQQECQAGFTGEPGFGMYFTEAQDWEIVEEE